MVGPLVKHGRFDLNTFSEQSEGNMPEGWQKGKKMTDIEKNNWLDNISSAADMVAGEVGWEKVKFVLHEYGGGASSIESLSSNYYESVYNELFDYEVGLSD